MLDFSTLKGKVVLITGGFGQIGEALVSAFLKSGSFVYISDIENKEDVEKKWRKISDQFVFVKSSIHNKKDVDHLLKTVIQKMGRLDVLINNAYPRNKNYGRPLEEIEWDDFNENVQMHLGGYFLLSQKASEIMRKHTGGSIINLGSIYGMVAPRFSIYEGTSMTMPAEYAAIKGGVLQLTRYLATYLAPYGIRVNAVSPGGLFNGQNSRFVKSYEAEVPLGRVATPDDVVGPILFLASDLASYITGQNIAVDGGWTTW